MKIKKPLYIVTKDNSLLVREIESEDENTVTVKSRFYVDILITYEKSENIFKNEKEALKFQFRQSRSELQKAS